MLQKLLSIPKYTTMNYRNCSIGSNPLRLPLNRGRDKLAPPLLRGGWEGFESDMIYEKINNDSKL
jgi:hypothetical protein